MISIWGVEHSPTYVVSKASWADNRTKGQKRNDRIAGGTALGGTAAGVGGVYGGRALHTHGTNQLDLHNSGYTEPPKLIKPDRHGVYNIKSKGSLGARGIKNMARGRRMGMAGVGSVAASSIGLAAYEHHTGKQR